MNLDRDRPTLDEALSLVARHAETHPGPVLHPRDQQIAAEDEAAAVYLATLPEDDVE